MGVTGSRNRSTSTHMLPLPWRSKCNHYSRIMMYRSHLGYYPTFGTLMRRRGSLKSVVLPLYASSLKSKPHTAVFQASYCSQSLSSATTLASNSRRYFQSSSQRSTMKDVTKEETRGLNGTTDLPSDAAAPSGNVNFTPKKINAWSGPGQAAFDFRSDVVTTPTASMLEAISNTTLLDDVFVEDPTTNDLEAYMAQRTGHQAALFVLSGTMGNQLALRSHLTQPPYSVLCDHRAHIACWEAGGVASLCGAMVYGIVPSNGVYLTLEDIKKNVILGDEIHGTPTRVISLENTLGGTILPLEEIKKISAFAKEHDIRLHLDGARIWEAVVAGAGSLPEYCSQFDSVSLCFSKGLGAPVGSILVGSPRFIKQARWVRKSIGGGLRQPGVVTAAARIAVDETFGKDDNGKDGKLASSHATAKKIAQIWIDMGGKLEKPTETNMVWFDLASVNVETSKFIELGKTHGLRLLGARLVVHYQISDEAVVQLEKILRKALALSKIGMEKVVETVGEKAYGT